MLKKTLYLFLLLLLASCGNTVKNISRAKEHSIDTVSTTEIPLVIMDTTSKISRPFTLNTVLCYWKNHPINEDETVFTLINGKTNEKLLDQTIGIRDIDLDPKSGDYFEKLNEMVFTDINLDGLKDFVYTSVGSLAMTSMTNIFIFNRATGQFEFSEDLSATSIELDPTGRKLITSDFGRDFEVTKTHYFDPAGKVKYTEVLTQYSQYIDGTEFPAEYKTYEKIVNGKVVETRKDSIMAVGK